MSVEYIHVTGFKELKAQLEELPKRIGQNVLRGAVNAGATVIRDEAIRLAPEDTGTLKLSIYQKQIPERSGPTQQMFYVSARAGRARRKAHGERGKEAPTTWSAFYARWVEYGHHYAPPGKFGFARRRHAMKALAAGEVLISGAQFVMAKPFMRPAIVTKSGAALDAMKAYMQKRIPLEVEKL